MSSSTQLTLLSARSSRSLSNQQLSSGRQSTVSSLARSKQNGLRSGRVEHNPLPVQQFRPFSISSSLSASLSASVARSKQPPSTLSASSAITGDTMSHNRLKQLKQVYSSNLYLFQCLAFIGFLLLAVRLYEVNKDINYLRHVSSAWLPNITAVPLGGSSTETLRFSPSTVSMLTETESDKTPFASPLASASTASLEPDEDELDEEESEISETEVRLKSRALKPDKPENKLEIRPDSSQKNTLESLPQPQAFQFRSNRFPSRSTTNGLTRTTSSSSSSSSSPSSSSASTSPLSSTTNALSSTNGLSSSSSSQLSSTPNTTPLSTQVDSIQREIDLAKARSAYYHVENLRKDVDSLIGTFKYWEPLNKCDSLLDS